MQPESCADPPPAPTPELAELLQELAKVEHELEALQQYRAQLKAKLAEVGGTG